MRWFVMPYSAKGMRRLKKGNGSRLNTKNWFKKVYNKRQVLTLHAQCFHDVCLFMPKINDVAKMANSYASGNNEPVSPQYRFIILTISQINAIKQMTGSSLWYFCQLKLKLIATFVTETTASLQLCQRVWYDTILHTARKCKEKFQIHHTEV